MFFPRDHPTLPGFVFQANVSNHLSFLKLDFVCPATSAVASPIVSMVSSPRLKPDFMLWHHRFGHIGMDATKATLTKEYVTGVHCEGPMVQEQCVACIVGKSPHRSYSNNGHRASKVGELLHMDLCGPYPTQALHGERYFYNILDDKSNFGFTCGLKLKVTLFLTTVQLRPFWNVLVEHVSWLYVVEANLNLQLGIWVLT